MSKTVTYMVGELVIFEDADFEEFTRRLKLTHEPPEEAKIVDHTRRGGCVIFERDAWASFRRLVRGSKRGRGGGDCDEFCESVCDECDFAFGQPPECGAVCGDGSVILQL